MHYRDGREAKNGDTVIQINDGKIVNVGIMHDSVPGNEYCNGGIAPTLTNQGCACLCDCLHMDTIMALLKEKGLDVRPKGM